MQTPVHREQIMTEGSNLVDNKMIWKKKLKKVISILDEEPLFPILYASEENGRIRSNTISATSLRPSSYGASQPSSIWQADSLPMGKVWTVSSVL